MGQYFKCINIDHREFIESSGGLKLMEHSYIGNSVTDLANYLLSPEGPWHQSRIVWAGDYMDDGLYLDQIKDLDHYLSLVEKDYEEYSTEYNREEVSLYSVAEHFQQAEEPWSEVLDRIATSYPYFLNHTKKEYVDLQTIRQDRYGYRIHPLPILTSSGNGRGGGDFWGLPQNDALVGHWVGDVISAEADAPTSDEWKQLDAHFFELNNYHSLGFSPTESKLHWFNFRDNMYQRDETFKELMKLVDEFKDELQSVSYIKARLTQEQVKAHYNQRVSQIQDLASQMNQLQQKFEDLIHQEYDLLSHLSSFCQVSQRSNDYLDAHRFERYDFIYLNEAGLVQVLDRDNEALNAFVSGIKKALAPVIEREKQTFAISTGELIDIEDKSSYYICPCCGGADVLAGRVENADGISMCQSCLAHPRTFTVFTPSGRPSKTVTVGKDGDFESLTEFKQFLEKQNRFAQQTIDLPETDYRDKRLNFKQKLEYIGWDFGNNGLIQQPLSRCQYNVRLETAQ